MNKPTKSPKKSKAKRSTRPTSKKQVTKKPKMPITKASPKSVSKAKKAFDYTPASGDPFRAHSSYSVVYSVLHHAGDKGISRQDLIAEVSRITGKDPKHASYDTAVLLSAKQNGSRHQSCKPGFWIERTNDQCKLRTT